MKSVAMQLTLENSTQLHTQFATGNTVRRGSARDVLFDRYADKLKVIPALTRALVSNQTNKSAPFYRWFKYREGFSSELVRQFLSQFKPKREGIPRVLDPFAGSGTTLTTATKNGWQSTGIELLPVGAAAIRARILADTVDIATFEHEMTRLAEYSLEEPDNHGYRFPHIRITAQAFTQSTEVALAAYQGFLATINSKVVRELFHFACLAILEDVSYTRKDGQYLRWDNRSGRVLKATFNKGEIYEFRLAVTRQLELMLEDIRRRNGGTFAHTARLIEGSCLIELSQLKDESFDLVVTSPPYCNRYDYTRTYALELAFLGHGEDDVKRLRQTLLSATVENKSKRVWLSKQYEAPGNVELHNAAVSSFDECYALQEVLSLLYAARDRGQLNNKNIPNLVENYFFEMGFVVHELARTLAPGGHIVMVNDNVQYIGEEVPVDLILSDFAERAGLTVENIWVLPKGKGNSSQQMGIHGRKELRKCVYVWSKPTT
jgi:SAM-dependent methyltransferase